MAIRASGTSSRSREAHSSIDWTRLWTQNTLVVERADLLGLGQMHQLRGRVGRSGQRAYAYLFPRRLQ